MSYQLSGSDVLFIQRLLKADGFYTGRLDSMWGPKTEAASNAFEVYAEVLRDEYGVFDFRTEKHILSLSVYAQEEARLFMLRAYDAGINLKIISGTRTYEEQNKLFRQGRYGNPGRRITNARGGRSNHNFGIAWDVAIFSQSGRYLTANTHYDELAEIVEAEGVEWGGNWNNFYDPSHYQVTTVKPKITWVRNQFEKGREYVA